MLFRSDGGGTISELAQKRVPGKPYIVTEYNNPAPGDYQGEAMPLVSAYGALQDWDGIFWYTLLHADLDDMNSSVAGHFDLAMDAGRIAQLAPGALLFLRGDVSF